MSFDDSRPIWIQLAEIFGQKIVSGEWQPGAKIPSVRELALEQGLIQTRFNAHSASSTTMGSRSRNVPKGVLLPVTKV
ncbi:hypothetical protein [Trueperella pyogenes]|uniref:hypothetical protein n=1 Tax=Trueperella pyogenes TaxID=1661 RepID=UPI003DA7AF90